MHKTHVARVAQLGTSIPANGWTVGSSPESWGFPHKTPNSGKRLFREYTKFDERSMKERDRGTPFAVRKKRPALRMGGEKRKREQKKKTCVSVVIAPL